MQGKSLEKRKYNSVPNEENSFGIPFALRLFLSPYAATTYDERGPPDSP
jgi:hypothetical protein